MAKVSFEVYTLKSGQWLLDSVFNEKQDATTEAWRILNIGRFDGVRVIQESYDDATNKAITTNIFNRLKSDENKPVKRRQAAPNTHESHVRVATPTSQKKSATTRHFGMMSITLCVILLGIVGIAFYYLDKFKG